MSRSEEPVILATFGDLLKHGYRLNGTCRDCRVNRDVDLANCPAERTYVGQRFKCRDCGSSVMISLSQIVTCRDGPLEALDKWRSR
ncbi:hypothetical protein [Hoeflea sp.]|uniref:hypothetical protein n=1 Tax=Hoeflea sp. TaxID=1940281 RepID=UPI003A8FAA40